MFNLLTIMFCFSRINCIERSENILSVFLSKIFTIKKNAIKFFIYFINFVCEFFKKFLNTTKKDSDSDSDYPNIKKIEQV